MSHFPAALRLIIHMPMTPRRPITAAMLLALSFTSLTALGGEAPSAKTDALGAEARSAKAAQSARDLRDRAADFTFNLDHDEAIRLLRQAIAVDPNDSANHRALASTIWLNSTADIDPPWGSSLWRERLMISNDGQGSSRIRELPLLPRFLGTPK